MLRVFAVTALATCLLRQFALRGGWRAGERALGRLWEMPVDVLGKPWEGWFIVASLGSCTFRAHVSGKCSFMRPAAYRCHSREWEVLNPGACRGPAPAMTSRSSCRRRIPEVVAVWRGVS